MYQYLIVHFPYFNVSNSVILCQVLLHSLSPQKVALTHSFDFMKNNSVLMNKPFRPFRFPTAFWIQTRILNAFSVWPFGDYQDEYWISTVIKILVLHPSCEWHLGDNDIWCVAFLEIILNKMARYFTDPCRAFSTFSTVIGKMFVISNRAPHFYISFQNHSIISTVCSAAGNKNI